MDLTRFGQVANAGFLTSVAATDPKAPATFRSFQDNLARAREADLQQLRAQHSANYYSEQRIKQTRLALAAAVLVGGYLVYSLTKRS